MAPRRRSSPSLEETMRTLLCLLFLATPLAAQVAPDATLLSGGPITVSEYKLPAAIDPVVSPTLATELWARVYRPASLGSSQHAMLVFLHGNHATCGRLAGPGEHFDINVQYTFTGTCPAGYIPVPSHAGYAYLAERLASLGYIVVSINANRGINAAPGVLGDRGLNLERGRLVLRHLQRLSRWNSGAEIPPADLSDLVGKIDFSHVGLLGHSRGGEGVRAAYNFYQADPGGTNWQGLIGPVTFEGIFEIGPVDGQTALKLNALGTAWNVLLPMCDGDVFNLQGVKPFDRMLRVNSESPVRQKSTFAVWGANHNFFNTEWQQSDSAGCFANQRLFAHQIGPVDARPAAIASAVAFFVANVGATKLPDYNRIFNPQFELPPSVDALTRVDRGYTDSPDASLTTVFDDFTGPTGFNSHGPANTFSNISLAYGHVANHSAQQFAGLVSWNGPGADTFFQSNWTNPNSGVDASTFGTLDFRVSRQCANPADLLCNKTSNWFNFETNFSIRLVGSDGTLSNPVQLKDYLSLTGPVGSLVIGFGTAGHPILQTTRIPLTAFGSPAIVSNLRGVRFTFDDTRRDEIYLANIQLSKLNGLLAPITEMPTELPTADTALDTTTAGSNDVNQINSMRSAQSAALGSTVEIELNSNREFLPQGEMLVLRIGSQEFNLSRYPVTGETTDVVFTLTADEFARVSQGDPVQVQYGSGPNMNGWNFGKVDKNMLGR